MSSTVISRDESCMGLCSLHPESDTRPCPGCPMPPDDWTPPRPGRVVELPGGAS